MNESKKIEFLMSLLTLENGYDITVTDCLKWLDDQRKSVAVTINKVPFSKLENWIFNKKTGDIQHVSGKFFSIQGIEISTNFGIRNSWQQPIINQPEIGILGIITKNIKGTLHFLLQAKIEPGNINYVQLSPTLQATKSNYSQVHGGNKPPYLDYFTGKSVGKSKILIDQLQSEQGARFLKKRNRNIILEVNEEIPLRENFIWLTLGQIKALLRFDNIVNMDTRTVISSISYGKSIEFLDDNILSNLNKLMLHSAIKLENAYFDYDELIAWITRLKITYELNVKSIGLKSVEGWKKNSMEIFQFDRKYFKVLAVDVNIGNREVVNWSQPIIESAQEGILGFLVKKINDAYHFLVQAKVEAGNFDILELAPTVQCLTGNYRKGVNEYDVPYIDLFLNADPSKIIHKSFQSEEGGRFFREQNLNLIIEVDEKFDLEDIPINFNWMTLGQLMEFIKHNNYINIQARSLISCIDFV